MTAAAYALLTADQWAQFERGGALFPQLYADLPMSAVVSIARRD